VCARREYEGGLVAWLGCLIVAHIPFTGKPHSPQSLNPYGAPSGAAEKIAEVKRFITGMGLRAIAKHSQAAKERSQRRGSNGQ
jgi:hypothetical protein